MDPASARHRGASAGLDIHMHDDAVLVSELPRMVRETGLGLSWSGMTDEKNKPLGGGLRTDQRPLQIHLRQIFIEATFLR